MNNNVCESSKSDCHLRNRATTYPQVLLSHDGYMITGSSHAAAALDYYTASQSQSGQLVSQHFQQQQQQLLLERHLHSQLQVQQQLQIQQQLQSSNSTYAPCQYQQHDLRRRYYDTSTSRTPSQLDATTFNVSLKITHHLRFHR